MYFSSGESNVARYKTVRQSTTQANLGNGETLVASKANDGDKRRSLPGGSCSHTSADGQTRAWWQVDLGKPYVVSGISITPRDNGKFYYTVAD